MANKKLAQSNSKKTLLGNKVFRVIVLVILLSIILPLAWFKYEDAQANKVFNSVKQSDWVEISSEKYGSRDCFTTCPGQSRTYSSSYIDRSNAVSEFTKIITDQGYMIKNNNSSCSNEPENSYSPSLCGVGGERGDLYLGMSLNESDGSTNISVHFGHNSYLFGFFKE